MQRNKCLICSAACLLLFYFVPVCSTQKHPECVYAKHIEGNHVAQSRKKFCDPSFSNQTAGVQKCSPGLYREWNGPKKGQCVPCSCNGLSSECNEQTGNCVNCQFNTVGHHCEQCKEGYYGNAATRTCRACPCPSTWNNFALACLDIGSGQVECLCKRGYHGNKCDRCSSGYYGNPLIPGGLCRPCNCKDDPFNICDSLTGECVTSGNNSWDDKYHECDTCSKALLDDLEQMDDSLGGLKWQLQSISTSSGSLARLNNLQAHISETKIQVGGYSTTVRRLEPKVEPLEADVDVVKDNLSRLIDETLEMPLNLEMDVLNVNKTNLRAEDLLKTAESLPKAVKGLMKHLAEVKPEDFTTLTENNKARMLEKAWHIVLQMRKTNCTSQRDTAGREQQKAHKLLDFIRTKITAPLETNQTALNQTSDTLMVTLRDMAELQSNIEDTVSRTQGLNLKSHKTLDHLQHLQTQLEKEQSVLFHLTEMTKDLLQNITGMFAELEEKKNGYEKDGAQLDGAKLELFKKLNKIGQIRKTLDIITKAEEHAEQLNQLAEDLKQVLHNTTSSRDLLKFLGIGAYNGIKNVIERAEMAANQSRVAIGQASEDVKEQGLVKTAQRLKENSSDLWKGVNDTHSELKILSHTTKNYKSRVNQQKEKGELLTMDIAGLSDNLKKIKRDDTDKLIASAKTAASDSNSTVSFMAERLKNISWEVDKITPTNLYRSVDYMLNEAEQALKNLSTTLPLLEDNLTQVDALSRTAHPHANMTESIQRIKDLIEETRNFVNRLSIATTFNGKGHVELRLPRNLVDLKAFTAVDLLLNLHRNGPSNTERGRKRRQGKHKDVSHFVLYLGDKNASGDYIGMAIRRNVLICVYKLGGMVHQVASGEITKTNVNSSDLDKVTFHRLYQDAEVNVTQNFTSQKPVKHSLNRNLPNTLIGILHVDPESVVFYVGGYPEDFTPPVELRYPKYRGAMKLSYINDNPVCLFNYKHAVNINAKDPHVRIPHSDVSDYYEGTGYRMAFIKDKKRTRLFKFHTNSRETEAMIFYIGNEESYFCVYVERGFLVIQGKRGSREFRAQSVEKVSLFDKKFAIITGDKFKVQYGSQVISTDHGQTQYTYFYIGGVSAELRQRYNITAPPLRGCVDHVTANTEIVQYDRTIAVGKGCPVSLLGVRTAALESALPVESLFVRKKLEEVRVSLGFRTKDRHNVLLRSSGSQGSTSDHDFQLALADGYVVFKSDNYTLKSEKTYNDGSWHYLSALGSPTGLELSVDNVNVIQGQSPQNSPVWQYMQEEKHKACITNLYARRFEQSFIPADLSSFPQTENTILGLCSLDEPRQTRPSLNHMMKKPKKHKKPVQPNMAVSQCRQWTAPQSEYQLYERDSWMSFTFPQEDLNHRPHFSLDIKTTSSKGLILLVAGRGLIPLLALYVANGKIKMSLGQNRIIEHKQRSNDGNWHRVEFSVEKSAFHLLVDGLRVTDGQLPHNEGSSLNLHNPVYLGADTKSKVTKGHNVPMSSFVGCIRVFRMNDVLVEKPEASYRTLPCLDGNTVKGAYFGADGGYVVLDNYFKVGPHFELTFELRPEHLTGLLFHLHGRKSSLKVFLVGNKVGVEVNDGSGALSVSVNPLQSLCDGTFHAVTVSKQKEVVKLVVDSTTEQKAGSSTSTSTTLGSLYMGGTPKSNQAPVSSPFVGCLRNVKVNGQPVAFERASRVVGNVSLHKCPAV